MRLSSESDALCQLMWQVYTDPISNANNAVSLPLLSDVCYVHGELLRMERLRGPGVFHSVGVLPKSRRILLNVASRIGLSAMKTEVFDQEAIHTYLNEIVQTSLKELSIKSSEAPSTAAHLYQLCEASYDVAAFPSEITRTVFLSDTASEALDNVVSECAAGYKFAFDNGGNPSQACVQWGRLRGGLVTLFRSCNGSGIPPVIVQAVRRLVVAECESVICTMGQTSSSIFVDHIIGEEMLPAGAFVKVLGEYLESALSDVQSRRHLPLLCTDTIVVLHESLHCVSQAVASKQSFLQGTSLDDPRPSILQAWYLTMRTLASLCYECPRGEDIACAGIVCEMLSHSCCIAVQLVLLKHLTRKMFASVDLSKEEGTSLDGPQTLAMLDFLEAALLTGPTLLGAVVKTFAPNLNLDFGSSESLSEELVGGTIMAAALFRMLSGALPPWAIENVPGLFRSMFVACNGDSAAFCKILSLAVDIRLRGSYGGVNAGEKMAGPFIETLSDSSKKKLVVQSEESALKNDTEGWRRMKVLVKQLCGGKKKTTSFTLKPAYSTWDCDRL